MGTRLLTIITVLVLPTLMVTVSDERPDIVLEQSGNITIHAGKDTTIRCESGAGEGSAVTCLWLWEYPQRNGAPTVVAGFPGHGPTTTDCSINLVNVSQIQTGWWTCRAQNENFTILHTNPVFLQVITSPAVTFEVQPVNRTFSVGTTAELECKSSIPVQSCQWRFQQKGQTDALVVTEGPPKDDKDCSFKLEQVSYEQVGAWTCGARTDDSDQFTYTHTVYIQVEHKEEAFPVEFLEEPEDTVVELGQTGQLHCKIHQEAHIEDCRWYWQPLSHSKAWKVLMREFLPEDNDCSIEFTNVTADPEGLWVCHVKPIHSDKFKASKPAKLTVRGAASVSTLTRDVSVSEGEPLTLLCISEQPAKTCQWKRRAFEAYETEPNQWSVEGAFPSTGVEMRDCSFVIDHAKMDHQGLWVCGIQVHDDQPFLETMPTAVTVKAPNVVRFVDPPRTQLAAEDAPLRLNCSTLSAVRECLWTWYEDDTKVSERVVKYNFTADKLDNHDCGIVIPKVDRSLQGIWQCGVRYGDPGYLRTTYARPFSLTVVKTGPISFRSVSSGEQIAEGLAGGAPEWLECVVREPVEECVWLFQEDLRTPAHQFSRFKPKDFNNCSLRLSANVSDVSGWWTCGARNTGDFNFTMAPPFRVNIVRTGNVSSKSMISADDLLVLMCQMPQVVVAATCDWIHPSELNIFEFNSTDKYTVDNNPTTGVCSVTFRPMLVDVGHWKCVFSVNNKKYFLGEASFTVLSSPHNVRLSWIVGVLATVTLMLTVLLFVVITCRVYQCNRSSKASVQLNKPQPEHTKRYSEDPTKGINFSFNENPELLVDFSIPTAAAAGGQDQHNHHYERVGRYVSQRPSFYQNVN